MKKMLVVVALLSMVLWITGTAWAAGGTCQQQQTQTQSQQCQQQQTQNCQRQCDSDGEHTHWYNHHQNQFGWEEELLEWWFGLD